MKNLMKNLVTLSATTMLLAGGPAFARGGGGSFGHASFAAMSPHSSLGAFSHDRSSEHSFETRSNSQRTTSSKEERHGDRPHRQDNSEHKVVRVRDVQKIEHKKLELDSRKPLKIASKSTTLVKHGHKLTENDYARAKLSDSKGRHYDAAKKAWTDGKGHWWFGRFAWVFIDDVWYYGNARWSYNDDAWSCNDSIMAARPSRIKAVELPPTAASPLIVKSEPVTEASTAQTLPKPIKPASLASKLPPPQAPLGQMQQTGTKVETTELPSIETAALVTPPIATANPVDAAQPAGAVECKRFLPGLSLTISVPCAE